MSADELIAGSQSTGHVWDLSAAISFIRSQTDALTARSSSTDGSETEETAYVPENGDRYLDNTRESPLGNFGQIFSLLRLNRPNGEVPTPVDPLSSPKQVELQQTDELKRAPSLKTLKRARRRAAKRAREEAASGLRADCSRRSNGLAEKPITQEVSPILPINTIEADAGRTANGEVSKVRDLPGDSRRVGVTTLLKAPETRKEVGRHLQSHTDGEYYDGLSERRVQQSFGGAAVRDTETSPRTPLLHASESDSSDEVNDSPRVQPEQARRGIIQDILGTSKPNNTAVPRSKTRRKDISITRRRSASDFNNTRLYNETAAQANVQKRMELIKLLFGGSHSKSPGFNRRYTPFLPATMAPPSRNATDKDIHVFVDISNILIGFHDTLKYKRGISKTVSIPRQRLSFSQFALLLERNRNATKRVLVGSDALECVREAAGLGYECNILERVVKTKKTPKKGHATGEHPSRSYDSGSEFEASHARKFEQGVDEILHLKMLESLLDVKHPATIVLATGDAAVAEYSGGFLRMIERALDRGWSVEVVAFSENMSGAYRNKAWTAGWNGRFKAVMLDEFVELLRLDI